jgi:hypothetical protein
VVKLLLKLLKDARAKITEMLMVTSAGRDSIKMRACSIAFNGETREEV